LEYEARNGNDGAYLLEREALRQAIEQAEKQEFGDTSAAYMVGVQDGKKQREWVGLTDEERNHIWDVIGNSDAHGDVDGWSGRDVMAAIEAKLKEKNT